MLQDTPYVLGLDLGTNSIGWALIEQRGPRPNRIVDCGVRVFEAGLEGDISSGKAEPRNANRRMARQIRRQTERRRRRKQKAFRLLQQVGLLPKGSVDKVIPPLDRTLTRKFLSESTNSDERRKAAHLLPYRLRARALNEKLELHELGRALYHLAQRRGFLSNRKTDTPSSDAGVVRQGITDLAQQMDATHAPTIGAYFASLDPEMARVRGRWTARSMYQEELRKIWERQKLYYPHILTEDFYKKLQAAIFFQRPLKSVKDLIGHCSLEIRKKRAQWPLLEAQDFRILQKINDTRVLDIETGEHRPLSESERRRLYGVLGEVEVLSFAKAKKALGLKNHTFNWEDGGEKKFPGNRTAARIRTIIGDRWVEMTAGEREALVDDLLSINRHDTMVRRAHRHWGLDNEKAEKLSLIELEAGYCNLSRKALQKINPLLRQGLPFATATKQLYPDAKIAKDPLEFLPLVEKGIPELRNPVVSRVLTELRKVINGIIREHGRPMTVRVELARDLKSSREEKKRTILKNRTNERSRQEARRKILQEIGVAEPTRHDILKVQLAEECNWECPYTGRPISMQALIGPHSQFDIEHIIPFSRCFDNSFVNKTLCYAQENRNRKGNSTPEEAYGSEAERFETILGRVARFQGPLRAAKLKRFRARSEDEIEGFRSSQLNDTRYASTLAVGYLGLLFGGAVDGNGRRRVHATKGSLSAILRRAWNLNSILSRDGRKTREDHRHLY